MLRIIKRIICTTGDESDSSDEEKTQKILIGKMQSTKSVTEWRTRTKKTKRSRRYIDNGSDIDVSIGRRQGVSESVNRQSQRNNFTIKDVEGSLSYFIGDDKLQWEITIGS